MKLRPIVWNRIFLVSSSIVIFSLFVMIFLTGGRGEQIIVDQEGGGDHETIGDAVDEAVDGDIIVIEPGIYREDVRIERSITLMGRDRKSTIINGSGGGKCIQISGSNIGIHNLSLRNGDFGMYADEASNCSITNLTCSNMDFEGVHLGRSVDNRLENISIENCSTGLQIFQTSRTVTDHIRLRSTSAYHIFLFASENNSFSHLSTIDGSRGLFFFNSNNNTINIGNISNNTRTGISSSSSIDISINDTIFSHNSPYDLIIDQGSHMRCYNISACNENGTDILPTFSVSDDCTLLFSIDLRLNILNATGSPIPSATLFMERTDEPANSTINFHNMTSVTDMTGYLWIRELPVRFINRTDSINFTYSLKLERGGWRMSPFWKALSMKNGNISVLNIPPILENISISSQTGNESQIFLLQVNASDDSPVSLSLIHGSENITQNWTKNGNQFLNFTFPKGVHECRFLAFDGIDETLSEPIHLNVFDDVPPASIRIESTKVQANSSLFLSWNSSISPDLSHYQVYLSNHNFSSVLNMGGELMTIRSDSTSITITDLESGIEYFVAITAVDDSGNELASVSPTPIKFVVHLPHVSSISINTLSIVPSNPIPNENTSISFSVINNGSIMIPTLDLTLLVDDISILSLSENDVPINALVTDTLEWKAIPGHHNITLRITFDNHTISRSIELNIEEMDGEGNEEDGEYISIFTMFAAISLVCLVIVIKKKKNGR